MMKMMCKSMFIVSVIGIVFFALSCKQAEQSADVVNKKLSNGGEVNGPRSIENIEQHLKQLQPRFDFFYKKHKKLQPDMEGTIQLIFEIDENGEIEIKCPWNSSNHAISLIKKHLWIRWPL